MDATGISRYLPVFVYVKGVLEKAAYIGRRLESVQHESKPLWAPQVEMRASGSVDVMQKAVA